LSEEVVILVGIWLEVGMFAGAGKSAEAGMFAEAGKSAEPGMLAGVVIEVGMSVVLGAGMFAGAGAGMFAELEAGMFAVAWVEEIRMSDRVRTMIPELVVVMSAE